MPVRGDEFEERDGRTSLSAVRALFPLETVGVVTVLSSETFSPSRQLRLSPCQYDEGHARPRRAPCAYILANPRIRCQHFGPDFLTQTHSLQVRSQRLSTRGPLVT